MIRFMVDSRYLVAYPEKKKAFSEVENDSFVEIFINEKSDISIRVGANLWTIEKRANTLSTMLNDLINQLASSGYRVIEKSSTSGKLQREKPGTIEIYSYTAIPFRIGGERIELKSKGGCFIATAAYGSSLSPQVMELRCFRDNILLNYHLGKLFVKYYELISPPLAQIINKSHILQCVIRTFIVRPAIFFVKRN